MMFKKISPKTWLILIFSLGIILRLIGFPRIPLSLNRDEVSLGYNAFSIATEGIDEWGVRFPLMFKAFGDYKLPGYIYFLVPFIKTLGNTDLAVRLPSLLAGIANIFLIYLISRSVYKPSQRLKTLLPALSISLAPWAIHYSSVAFEAHLALSWALLSIWLLLKTVKNPKYIYLSTLTYLVAQNTYNTPLLLSLPLILGFLYFYKKKMSLKNPHIIAGVMLWLVGTIATGFIQFSAFSHKGNTAIFYHPDYISAYWQANSQANQAGFPNNILVNKFTFFGLEIGKKYLDTFSPNFLVFQGGSHPWHSIPDWGHLGTVQYILVVLGLYRLIFKSKSSWEKWLLFLILISPLPSAITNDAPHTTRSLVFLSLLAFIVPYGLRQITKIIKYPKLTTLVVILIVLESLVYKYDYLYKFPENHTFLWKVGLKDAVVEVQKDYSQTHSIYITDFDWSPYIYLLYYNQIPPSEFIQGVQHHLPDNIGYTHVKSFNNYYFWADPEELPEKSILLDQVDNKYQITIRD